MTAQAITPTAAMAIHALTAARRERAYVFRHRLDGRRSDIVALRPTMRDVSYFDTTNLPIASCPDVLSCGANAMNFTSLTSRGAPVFAPGG